MVKTYGLVILLVISNIASADDAQENLKTCLYGQFPTLCKKHLLTQAEKAQVLKAEKRENLKTCLYGQFPTLCKKHLLTQAEKAQVVKAEKRENLKTCLEGQFPTLCKKHLLTEAEKAQVLKAEKSYTPPSKTQYRNTTTPRTYYYNSGLTFHGYDCTVDCSGHEAGYEWAEDNDINDVYDCDGNSDSFNEGCEAYVDENH